MHGIRALLGHICMFALCLAMIGPARADDDRHAPSLSIEVEGGVFRVTRNGRVLRPDELIGAKLTIRDERGTRRVVRIDNVILDPIDPMKELYLYDLKALDANSATAEWRTLCQPGADGLALAFPLQGSWSQDGRHRNDGSFTMTCTAGAIGKCVRFGYKPWRTSSDGQSLWDYHQACTRMVRADYCGTGESATRDGTVINLYDRIGIQTRDDNLDFQFEAGWTPEGAICVQHARIPSIDSFKQFCGEKLRPAQCSFAATAHSALLWNESRQ